MTHRTHTVVSPDGYRPQGASGLYMHDPVVRLQVCPGEQ